MQNKIPTGLMFIYYACCYLQNYLAWPAATPNKLAEPPLISRSSMFLSLCRAATTRDTRWWWTRWSTTFTSSPVGSSTPRPLPSSVCNGDTSHSLAHNTAKAPTLICPRHFGDQLIVNPFNFIASILTTVTVIGARLRATPYPFICSTFIS